MTSSAAYWDSEHIDRGTFNWGAIPSPEFAKLVAGFARSSESILVAGAGTSHDALEIARALPRAKILAVDFSSIAVSRQTALGIPAVHADLSIFQHEWQKKFDVVIDAVLLDVMMSDWKGDSQIKRRAPRLAKTIAHNLQAYVKPGGLYVSKSNTMNVEEYSQFIENFKPLLTMEGSEIVHRYAHLFPVAHTKSGRPTKPALSVTGGHVAIWQKLT